MKEKKTDLYELIISQLLEDGYTGIADQLYWAAHFSKSILPGSQLNDLVKANKVSEKQKALEECMCVCGHPWPNCEAVVSAPDPEEVLLDELPAATEASTPKKRGRPPKHDASTPKRKRGRPKKNKPEDKKKSRSFSKLHRSTKSVKREIVDFNNDDIPSDLNDSSEITTTTSDQPMKEVDKYELLAQLDKALNPDIDYSFESQQDKLSRDIQEIEVALSETTKTIKTNKQPFSKQSKYKSVSAGKSYTQSKNGVIVKKTQGIACKLIKKAVRNARAEHKENRKRPSTFMCNLCLKKYSLPALKEHLKEHCTISGEELHCNICSKKLLSGNRILNFNLHLRLHGTMHHFLCSECGTTFKSEGAYKYHKEMHKEKCHACEICNKVFRARGLLRSHMTTHSSARPHICEYCAKAFRTPTLLAKHVMIHTGEKPFKCDECGASFRLGSHLRRHEDVHAGKKMFVCSECNHAVYQRTNMRVHMKVHTGVRYSPIHVCEKCKMVFPVKENMLEHTAICNLQETAYEQQQRLGIQQKPPPLRVRRPRQGAKADNSLPATLPTPTVVDMPENSIPMPPPAHQHFVLEHHPNMEEPLVPSRQFPQQFTTGVQSSMDELTLQQQHQQQQQDLLQQQTQFLQQFQVHHIYPSFYMQ